MTKKAAPDGELRIDRWLWFTRFYKTRGLAAGAVTAGHVRINGERARPSTPVREGDRIDLLRDQQPYRLTVSQLPRHRGPASEARACYVDDPETAERREAIRDELRSDRQLMPRTRGRPDKHTRRLLRSRRRQDVADD